MTKKHDDRQERLARALRENLRRRKSAAREAPEAPPARAGTDPDPESG